MLDERSRRALAAVDTSGRGLEIGPSYNPLLPKSSGACVEVVDHATRRELVAKYEGYGLPPEKMAQIERVDHVLDGRPLAEVVGRPGSYDFILASNVVEHSVDLIGFLQDCETLLNPTGRLSLVVPDQRFCFDLLKPWSSVGAAIDAHLNPTRYHTPGSLLEHTAYACTRAGRIAWDEEERGDIALQFDDLTVGLEHVEQGRAQTEYHDNHRWKFTPSSFTLLIEDLRTLGYHSLTEVASEPRLGFEFFVTLGRSATAPPPDRLGLLLSIGQELAEVHAARGRTDLDRALQAARQEIDELRASTSWRITAPLRMLVDRARAVRRR